MDEFGLEKLDVTHEELDRFTKAFKNDEFKKLFKEYCDEIQDPENRRKYEEELAQMEAERGIDVTFIHPEPGYVIKTSANGAQKVFINICRCDKIAKPSSHSAVDPKTGEKGLTWSLPYSQAPPHRDFDKQKAMCVVYDVVFHPDTLHLAEKNSRFRQLVTDTACEAVQKSFNVVLDRSNLRFPKIAYKGMPRPTIIRKKSENPPENIEPSPIDKIYPPLKDHSAKANVKQQKPSDPKPAAQVQKYATPKYQITHRHNVDYHEMTDELDSKLNITVPRELIVSINLPLINSTNNVTLDVTSRKIYLVSETPAKYKLEIQLPYEVVEANGTAKFDKAIRKLVITLPVSKKNDLRMTDLCREDSGVESDHESPKQRPVAEVKTIQNVDRNAMEEHSLEESNGDDKLNHQSTRNNNSHQSNQSSFLSDSITYYMPSFTCDTMDNTVIVTLQVKNVDSASIRTKTVNDENLVQIKFTSIGSGFFPINHAFIIKFPEECEKILKTDVEAWDNNVILQIELECKSLSKYFAGRSIDDLHSYEFSKDLGHDKNGMADSSEKEPSIEVIPNTTPVTTSMKDESINLCDSDMKQSKSKKNKKKNKKIRSLSESNCDDLLSDSMIGDFKPRKISAPEPLTGTDNVKITKPRSLSESSNDDPTVPKIKSILKRRSSYNRSISESSMDDHMHHGSIDFSVGSIPEESGQEMSESVKKTVRFDNNIRKQLFKIRSSIVGQRKPQANKRKKKKRSSKERRNSECESSDGELSSSSSKASDISSSAASSVDSNVNYQQKSTTSNGTNNGSDSTATDDGSGAEDDGEVDENLAHLVNTMKSDDASLSTTTNRTNDKDNRSKLDFKCGMIFDIEV